MRVSRGSPAISRLAASLNRGCIPPRSPAPGLFCLVPQTCNKTDRRRFASSARRPAAADLSGLKDVLRISDEVADAVATNRPVVALESTIYTHGAFDEDLGLEEIVRKHGAVPAVCGVYNGVATVGLEKHEIQEMVHGNPAKISRRDLGFIVGDGLRGVKRHGGTTIAGTMILARLAGIRVFGTGGLGGVHRGAESSMDISADLTELGRTRVAVISAGCKGFLDIPRTLEYLETQGVAVATFNRDGEDNKDVTFPAFWARNSGVKSPAHVLSAEDAAYKIYAQEKLGIESGLLLANPIPKGADIPREVMEDAIERAVRDAEREGFTGSNNTPFILQRIREYTEGRSVVANLALVRDNVAVAAMVAERLSRILKEKDGPSAAGLSDGKPLLFPSSEPASAATKSLANSPLVTDEPATAEPAAVEDESLCLRERTLRHEALERQNYGRVDIVVAGSVALDLSCDYKGAQPGTPSLHTSNPASITQSVGGVGHNVALAAHRFGAGGVTVKLCSVVGDDVAGATVLDAVRAEGLPTSGIRKLPGARTAQYVAVNDSQKSLVLAMADMDILTEHPFPRAHWAAVLEEAQPKCLVVDANWSPSTIRSLLSVAGNAKTIFEPVSAAKSARLFEDSGEKKKLGVYPDHQVDLATPNVYELSAMFDAAKEQGYFHSVPEWFRAIDDLNVGGGGPVDYGAYFDRLMAPASDEVRAAGVPQKVLHLLPYIPSIVVKFGEHGALLAEIMAPDDARLAIRDENKNTKGFLYQPASVLTRAFPGAYARGVGGVYMRYYPSAEKVDDVVSVNGVGDTFLGVLVAGLVRRGKLHRFMGFAQAAAVMTLRSKEAVSPELGMVSRVLREERSWWNAPAEGIENRKARRNRSMRSLPAVEETSFGGSIGGGAAEPRAEIFSGEAHRSETMTSTAGELLEDRTSAAVREFPAAETVLEEQSEDKNPAAVREVTDAKTVPGDQPRDRNPAADNEVVPAETGSDEQPEEKPGDKTLAAVQEVPAAETVPEEQSGVKSPAAVNEGITETVHEEQPADVREVTGAKSVLEEQAEDKIFATARKINEAKTAAEVFGVGERGWSPQHAPIPLPRERTEISASAQVPTRSDDVKGAERTLTIPVAEKMVELLTKMGVSKKERDKAIKAVAAGGPIEFAKWRADYLARKATEKAAARAEALRAAERDRRYAQEHPEWGSYAKRGLQDKLGDLSVQRCPGRKSFPPSTSEVGAEEEGAVGDDKEKGT